MDDVQDEDVAVPKENTHSMIHLAKLERLPSSLQQEILSLSPAALEVLRSALCPHEHFDFMRLPPEIRLHFYELIFAPGPREFSPFSGKPIIPKIPCVQLLRVSKQIYDEAYPIFCRVNSFSFRYPALSSKPIERKLSSALMHSRRIDLMLDLVTWSVGSSSSASDSEAFVSRIIVYLRDCYEYRYHAQPVTVSITFNPSDKMFDPSCMRVPYLGPFHPEQTFRPAPHFMRVAYEQEVRGIKYAAAFLKAQLRVLVAAARVTLASCPNVRLETNVDLDAEGVTWGLEVRRCSGERIAFRDLEKRVRGEVLLIKPGSLDHGGMAVNELAWGEGLDV